MCYDVLPQHVYHVSRQAQRRVPLCCCQKFRGCTRVQTLHAGHHVPQHVCLPYILKHVGGKILSSQKHVSGKVHWNLSTC